MTNIVGYTYNADNYCNGECVLVALGPDNVTPATTTEQDLDRLALDRGIDRYDERSYDSGEFPKVIFTFQVESPERCAGCGDEFIG